MAKILIGNVKPVKGRDYLTQEDIDELGTHFAPQGFGLGGSARGFDINDIDNIKQSGWYYSTSPNGYMVDGFPVYFILMKVDSWWEVEGVNIVVQTLHYDNCQVRRTCDLNGWRPWEWVNPPMKVGEEYRTTEWWGAKHVYTKLIDCGALPVSGRYTVFIGEVGEIGNIIRFTGCCNYRSLPYRDPNLNGVIELSAESSYIIFDINVKEELQSQLGTAYVQIWYTKN